LLVLAGWFSSKAIGLHFAGLVAMSGIISIVNLALLLNALKVTWIQGLMMSVAYLLFAVCYFLQNE
jgi:Ca2+/H+ antiporter